MAPARWIGAAPLFLLLTMLLTGCGVSSVTDGGVPVGPTRVSLSGQVVSAVNPSQPIAGATLTLVDSTGAIYSAAADQSGSYLFDDVPPGSGALTISPPSGSGLGPQTIAVDIASDSLKAIAATVAPPAVYDAATGIDLSTTTLDVNLGGQAQLNATITGTGIPQGTQPSFVVFGGIGQVFSGGRFMATHPGAGAIVVTFGPYTRSIPVTVH